MVPLNLELPELRFTLRLKCLLEKNTNVYHGEFYTILWYITCWQLIGKRIWTSSDSQTELLKCSVRSEELCCWWTFLCFDARECWEWLDNFGQFMSLKAITNYEYDISVSLLEWAAIILEDELLKWYQILSRSPSRAVKNMFLFFFTSTFLFLRHNKPLLDIIETQKK